MPGENPNKCAGTHCMRPESSGKLDSGGLVTRGCGEFTVHERCRSRRTVHQHHPHAFHRRRATGQFGTPRHPHGHGPGGLLPVAAVPAVRSRRPHLAQSRPFRPVRRSRVHAAVLDVASHRGQGGQQGLRGPGFAFGAAGGPEAVPATGQPLSRPSGVPLDVRGGDHHRTVGSGGRHQRGHGHCRALDGQPLQPAGLRGPHRLRRVRPVRRRLHDGRRVQRGGVARGDT